MRNNYFVRLAKRTPRFGRALLVLAAAAGLSAAVWTGPAAAGSESKMLLVRTEPGAVGGPNFSWIKICGHDEGGNERCTDWTQHGSYSYEPVSFVSWRWQGLVTICKGGTAVVVDMSSQDGDWYFADLSAVEKEDAPSLQCL